MATSSTLICQLPNPVKSKKVLSLGLHSVMRLFQPTIVETVSLSEGKPIVSNITQLMVNGQKQAKLQLGL